MDVGNDMNKTSSRRHGFWSPAWIVLGSMAILALVVGALFARAASRDKDVMSQILFEKGTALIRAFESGARTGLGMRWSGMQLQMLLEETARQPDILYLAVTDENGLILAHSDRSLIGDIYLGSRSLDLSALAPSGQDPEPRRWRLTGPSGQGAFEVYGRFTPTGFPFCGSDDCPGEESGTSRPGFGRGQGFMRRHGQFPGGAVGGKRFIFAGFDPAPFEQLHEAAMRETALISGAALALGLAGVFALYLIARAKAAREKLRDARAFAAETMANLPVGLIATGPDGRITMVNAAAEALTGKSAAELSGLSPDAVFPPGWCGLKEKMEAGQTILEHETECPLAGAAAIPVSLSAARVHNEEGQRVGDVFILRDLREVRELRREVRRAEKLAALGSLAAGVAHEIRNPLSSIKGYATYFGSLFAPDSQEKQSADILIGEVDRLNRVVSQLLEFARPGGVSLRPTDPGEVARRAVSLIEKQAREKGVALEFAASDTGRELPLDPDRLTQALLNLYLNAVEATASGGTVRVSVEEANGGSRIRVADTGPGIPEADLSQIFNPYFTTKTTGTGLGLAIVHKIAEAHGALIEVDSAPGKGAVFTLTLPGRAPGASEGTGHG